MRPRVTMTALAQYCRLAFNLKIEPEHLIRAAEALQGADVAEACQYGERTVRLEQEGLCAIISGGAVIAVQTDRLDRDEQRVGLRRLAELNAQFPLSP